MNIMHFSAISNHVKINREVHLPFVNSYKCSLECNIEEEFLVMFIFTFTENAKLFSKVVITICLPTNRTESSKLLPMLDTTRFKNSNLHDVYKTIPYFIHLFVWMFCMSLIISNAQNYFLNNMPFSFLFYGLYNHNHFSIFFCSLFLSFFLICIL